MSKASRIVIFACASLIPFGSASHAYTNAKEQIKDASILEFKYASNLSANKNYYQMLVCAKPDSKGRCSSK